MLPTGNHKAHSCLYLIMGHHHLKRHLCSITDGKCTHQLPPRIHKLHFLTGCRVCSSSNLYGCTRIVLDVQLGNEHSHTPAFVLIKQRTESSSSWSWGQRSHWNNVQHTHTHTLSGGWDREWYWLKGKLVLMGLEDHQTAEKPIFDGWREMPPLN